MIAMSEPDTKEIKKSFNQVVKEFWEAKEITSAFAGLVQSIGDLFWSGLNKSFVNYDKADHTALAYMRANIYAFSAAKSLVEMKELSNLVVNKDKVRSFNDFKREALTIHKTYNVNYLRTEYNGFVATGQMSRKYLDIQADKDIFPLIQWVAVMDSNTRPEHARLNGITLPADDDFWKRYWAPLDHGCRCDKKQLRTGRVTPRANAIAKAKQAVGRRSPFFGNAAVDGQVIKKTHPYFTRKDYSNLKAVQDYGLRTAESIYTKGGLPRLKRGLTDKNSWNDQWVKWAVDHKGSTSKFLVNDKLDRPIVFDSNARDHIQRYHLADSIIDVLQNPDEIYSNDHQGRQRSKKFGYRYIKYFEGKPMIVEVEPIGNELRLVTAYDREVSEASKDRKGVLNYVERI